MQIKKLDGKLFFSAFKNGAQLVEKNKKRLNEINFFPVPDNDTGNNMSITLTTAAIKVEPDSSIYKTIKAISDNTVQAARGNSGLILAQFFSGLYTKMRDKTFMTTADFAENAAGAVKYLYENMENPTEGTMVTVIKDWADKLPDLAENIDDFVLLFEKSLQTARVSLEETQHKLEVHRKNKTVDAGAQGFVYFLEGILNHWRNGVSQGDSGLPDRASSGQEHAQQETKKGGELEYRYCTEALLYGEVDTTELKGLLAGKGDSLIVVNSGDKTRVHIHSNDPAEVMYILRDKARIIEQKADDMQRQLEIARQRQADIALVTDSIADIPQDLQDKYQIHQIPLNLIIDGVNYLDKATINIEYFFEYLEEAEDFPSSSQPTVDFIAKYLLNISEHYEDILIISVAEELSGTGLAFKQAIKQVEEETSVNFSYVDSKLNSGAQGLLVLEAAEAIAQGKSLEEVTALVEAKREDAKIYVNVNTFEYMVKGGRVSPMKGFFAKILNLKPIISLDETGKGTIAAKALSHKGVAKKILNLVQQAAAAQGIDKYAIVHSQAPELARGWQEDIQALLGFEPEYIMNISSITALSAGPGSVALSFITN